MERGLKIGELARRVGVSAKAIRFYEARHVLPPPTRGANRYRIYGQDALEMLLFVKQATGLGLTLGEVREIIAIRRGGRPPCAHVHRLLQDKARELDRKVRDLIEMRISARAWPPGGERAGAGLQCVRISNDRGRDAQRAAPRVTGRRDRGGLSMVERIFVSPGQSIPLRSDT